MVNVNNIRDKRLIYRLSKAILETMQEKEGRSNVDGFKEYLALLQDVYNDGNGSIRHLRQIYQSVSGFAVEGLSVSNFEYLQKKLEKEFGPEYANLDPKNLRGRDFI